MADTGNIYVIDSSTIRAAIRPWLDWTNDRSKLFKNVVTLLVICNHVLIPFDAWVCNPYAFLQPRVPMYWRVAAWLMFIVASTPTSSSKHAFARDLTVYTSMITGRLAIGGFNSTTDTRHGALLLLMACLTGLSNRELCECVRTPLAMMASAGESSSTSEHRPGMTITKKTLSKMCAWVLLKLAIYWIIVQRFQAAWYTDFSLSNAIVFRSSHITFTLVLAFAHGIVAAIFPRTLAMTQYFQARTDGAIHLLPTLNADASMVKEPISGLGDHAKSLAIGKGLTMILELPVFLCIFFGLATELCIEFILRVAPLPRTLLTSVYAYPTMALCLWYTLAYVRPPKWVVAALVYFSYVFWASLMSLSPCESKNGLPLGVVNSTERVQPFRQSTA